MLAQRKHTIVSALTALLMIVACSAPTVTPAVVSVTIDDGERSVVEGSTLALTVEVVTLGGAIEAVIWSSDEPGIATVSSAGVVMGVSPGEARITVTSAIDAMKSDTATITVTPPPATPDVLNVSIDAGERSVLVGETLQLAATVATVGGASQAVTWTSDRSGTATVSSTGLVSGIAAGEALITATSAFDASMRDSTLISVVSVPPGAPARISIVTGNNQTAQVGSAVPILPAVRVRDADENPLSGVSVTFTITTGNGVVAPSGPVTTNADGIATLSSWTLGNTAGVNGVRATVTGSSPAISVTFDATGVPGAASPATSTVTANPTSLLANGTAASQLTIQLKDTHGNDLTTGGATVTFATPSRGSIGAVTDHGNGTYSATYTAGTSAGTVTITPRLSGVNFSNTTTITLTASVVSVNIDQANPSVWADRTLQLTATVDTIGGASTAVTWSSSNTSVATIHPTTAIATGVASGTTTITATSTADSSKKSSATLTVREPLSLTVDTSLDYYGDGKTVTLTNLGSDAVASVAWGDGSTTSTNTTGVLTHTYATAGVYDITIRGTLSSFPRTTLITSLNAWGDFGFTSLAGAFSRSSYLAAVPDSLPATVTDLSRMFAGDLQLSPDVSNWDVSNVTNMSGMFAGSMGFTNDLSAWDVSSVTNMSMMFQSSYMAAQGLSTWDVSSVTNMSYMLADIPLRDDIGDWNVSNVTDMSGMFSYTWFFDHDIGGWDVSNVTDMSNMFDHTEHFNQDIGPWDVSNVTLMDGMFSGAEKFNQDLSGWCVPLIPTEPNGFQSWVQTLPLPIWGTCPGG